MLLYGSNSSKPATEDVILILCDVRSVATAESGGSVCIAESGVSLTECAWRRAKFAIDAR